MPKPVNDSFGVSNTSLATSLDVSKNDVRGGVDSDNLKPLITVSPQHGNLTIERRYGLWQVAYQPNAGTTATS